MEKQGSLSRRAFLGAMALGGAAAAMGAAGCAPKAEAPAGGSDAPAAKADAADSATNAAAAQAPAPTATGAGADWLGEEPATPDTFAEELEADVVVVGLGWAGVCATRAACEQGASVVVFEKGENFGLTSKNAHAFGSKLWLEHYPESEKYWDRTAIINAVMKGCLNRNSDAIMSKWLNTNGEAFDWFFGAALENPEIVFTSSAEGNKLPKDTTGIKETSWPYPANYNPLEEYWPCFPGTACVAPNAAPFFEANIAKAEQAAGDKLRIMRLTPAIKLLHDNGKVTGVVAQDADGNFYKATARKGVVLATGDFFSNLAMVNAFLSRRFDEDGIKNIYSVMDAQGNQCNVGDGHRMGAWAGAMMQLDGCNMTHAIGGGTYVVGTLPALLLNKRGQRFMNEDIQGQQFTERLYEQKDKTVFQIYDASFFEHMDDMPYGHGKHPEVKFETVQKEAEEGKLLTADTIEGLIEQMDIDKDTALASIKRYNELCAKGNDEDYGKVSKRMIGLTKPPFFCDTYIGDGSMKGVGNLVTMSGLESDEECHVYNADLDVIPGLYAAGNVQGNRFSVVYPEVLQGHSIAMAMTFGYIAGKNAAAGK